MSTFLRNGSHALMFTSWGVMRDLGCQLEEILKHLRERLPGMSVKEFHQALEEARLALKVHSTDPPRVRSFSLLPKMWDYFCVCLTTWLHAFEIGSCGNLEKCRTED